VIRKILLSFNFLYLTVFINHLNSPLGDRGMKELIDRLMAQGLTEQQSLKAIEVVKDFAKEKFPVFAGAIEKMFDKYKPKDEDDFLD